MRDVLPVAVVEFGVNERCNPPRTAVVVAVEEPTAVLVPTPVLEAPACSPSLCEPSLWTRSWRCCCGLSKAKDESEEEREVYGEDAPPAPSAADEVV